MHLPKIQFYIIYIIFYLYYKILFILILVWSAENSAVDKPNYKTGQLKDDSNIFFSQNGPFSMKIRRLSSKLLFKLNQANIFHSELSFFLKETCLSFIYWSFWRILTEFDHFHHFGTKSSTLFDYFSPRLTFLNHFDNFDLTIFLSFSVIFDHFKFGQFRSNLTLLTVLSNFYQPLPIRPHFGPFLTNYDYFRPLLFNFDHFTHWSFWSIISYFG